MIAYCTTKQKPRLRVRPTLLAKEQKVVYRPRHNTTLKAIFTPVASLLLLALIQAPLFAGEDATPEMETNTVFVYLEYSIIAHPIIAVVVTLALVFLVAVRCGLFPIKCYIWLLTVFWWLISKVNVCNATAKNYREGSACKLLENTFAKLTRPAIPSLIQALESKKEDVREGAFDVLEELGVLTERLILKKCIRDLQDNAAYSGTRSESARTLARLDSAIAMPAVPVLVKALTDNNAEVREGAAYALRNLAPNETLAVVALIKALGDNDDEVRRDAAHALHKIEVARALLSLDGTRMAPMNEYLKETKQDPPLGISCLTSPLTKRQVDAITHCIQHGERLSTIYLPAITHETEEYSASEDQVFTKTELDMRGKLYAIVITEDN